MHVEELTIRSFHEGLLGKAFSAREVVEAYYSRIAERDEALGAYLSLHHEGALAAAAAVDASVGRGEAIPLLAGAPLAIKDNILVAGTTTTAGSKILSGYTAAYDATVVRKLKAERAVVLGKTNLDEFGMGASTENSAFHITRNPFDPTRVPGGSSGGSAAAVAAGLALGALGSDTGGSVRQPAAFCGVVGLKPTYGSVSRFGLVAMASSLDQIGPITRTVEDAAIVFGAIRGADAWDATTSAAHVSVGGEGTPRLDLEQVRSLRIGVPKEYLSDSLDPRVASGVKEAMDRLQHLGFSFREVSLPHTRYALSAYYIVMPAEVSANLARFDGIRYARLPELGPFAGSLSDLYRQQRGAGFGVEARRRVLLGTFVLSAGYYDAYYGKAQRVRRLVADDFENVFREVEVILAPVTPTPAFKIGEKVNDPLAMYLSDVFTIPASLSGVPALSLPVNRLLERSYTELPVGFQLIGRRFHEDDILGIGQLYERA